MSMRGGTKGKTGVHNSIFRRGVAVCVSLPLVLLSPLPAQAHHGEVVDRAERERVERVSVSSAGSQADGSSSCTGESPSISKGGRYVAFTSWAGNLSPYDDNGSRLDDVFVRDRRTRNTDIVSVMDTGLAGPSLPGMVGNGSCVSERTVHNPDISDNGRFVAFGSNRRLTDTPDLTDPSAVATSRVFIRDRKEGKTTLVPIPPDVYGSNPQAVEAGTRILDISGNGRYVIFDISLSPDIFRIIAEGPQPVQLLLYDLTKNKTTLVSKSGAGEPANGDVLDASISATGRFVVLATSANNLTSDPDANEDRQCATPPGCPDVFVLDNHTNQLELASVGPAGAAASQARIAQETSAGEQIITPNGRYVVFVANGGYTPNTNFDPGTGDHGVFVRDRQRDRTERVTVSSTGWTLSAVSEFSLTDDGRYVSWSGNTGGCAGPCSADETASYQYEGHFVFDRRLGQTSFVEWYWQDDPRRSGGSEGGDWIHAVDATGRYHAFGSSAADRVEGDTNEVGDVFVTDLIRIRPGVGELAKSGKLTVSGSRAFRSSGVVSRSDAVHDLSDVTTAQGANLYGASLAYRPQHEDLFAAIELEHMPTLLPGISPIFYGLRFKAEDKSYEVHATSLLGGTFGLFDCTGSPTCTKVADLRGGYGTTGMRVVFSLPLEDIGLEKGGELKDVEAFSAVGGHSTGAHKILDRVSLSKN